MGDDDEDDDSSEEEVKDKRDKKTNGAYVPPKLVAMQYGMFFLMRVNFKAVYKGQQCCLIV